MQTLATGGWGRGGLGIVAGGALGVPLRSFHLEARGGVGSENGVYGGEGRPVGGVWPPAGCHYVLHLAGTPGRRGELHLWNINTLRKAMQKVQKALLVNDWVVIKGNAKKFHITEGENGELVPL